jgi:probable rRNA maturation factor
LNKQFLGRRASTDVLAFNLGQGVAERTWGQIVVCDEVARRIARKLGHRAEDELALYVAHGALHLLGETDDSPEKRERMRRLAARAMAKAGYRDVTSEGSKQKAEGRGQGKRGQICGIR